MPLSPLKGTVQQVCSVLDHEELVREQFAALKMLLRALDNTPGKFRQEPFISLFAL